MFGLKPAFATTAVVLCLLVLAARREQPLAVVSAAPLDVAADASDTDRYRTASVGEIRVAEAPPSATAIAAAADLAPLPNDAGRETVVVRPGDTLWRIAHQIYGDGGRARAIYEANRDQVADPARIYPGQVLVLP